MNTHTHTHTYICSYTYIITHTTQEQFERDIEEQRKLFRRLDADGNGELSKEEVYRMCSFTVECVLSL